MQDTREATMVRRYGFVEATMRQVALVEDVAAFDRWDGDLDEIHAFLAAHPAL